MTRIRLGEKLTSQDKNVFQIRRYIEEVRYLEQIDIDTQRYGTVDLAESLLI